ncbi:MAG: DUF481 domain-containing protein [Calditrichaeota bacterium]|nr:DUF481 domain-containing protein [Calditrichota bacterium]
MKVFIDCADCDFSYFWNRIRFVNFVRDPYLANVHVIIVAQKTASGGRRFTIRFIGKKIFKNIVQNLYYTSAETDTKDHMRQGLAKILELGLAPYISQTSMANLLKIEYDSQQADSVRELGKDSWMYWVFHFGVEGELEAEETQNKFNLVNEISAERITEIWKIRSRFKHEYERENFKENDEKITGKRSEWEADAEVIKSLSDHWSVGIFGNGNSSTRKNLNLSFGFAVGVEYNFFPWEQSDQRIFSVSYSSGIRSYKYHEETLFGKTAEELFHGRMRIELRLIQPWGDVNTSLENFHYYHDLTKYSSKLETKLALRITEGLAFTLDLEVESIHNQLYLPKGEATLEEILLEQKQLATNFDLSISFGWRYSFGSIYNNIVNRRF